MVTRAVIEETGLTSKWGTDQLRQQAELELRSNGGNLEAAVEALAGAWKNYLACFAEGKMRHTPMTAERFYGEGIWKNTTLWGLKNGYAPSNGKAPAKSRYQADLEEQMEERRRAKAAAGIQ